MIDRLTGTLVVPRGRIERDLTRASFLASPLAAGTRCDDMNTGWMLAYLGAQNLDGLAFAVVLHFEGERLERYSLSLIDPRYGTSWDDYTEEKQIAQRDANDAWLVASLGEGTRELSPRGPELRYALP